MSVNSEKNLTVLNTDQNSVHGTSTDSESNGNRILRRREVQQRTGLPRSTMYLAISQGQFPAPVQLSVRSVGWVQSEVDSWVAQKIAASRRGAQ